MFKNYFLTAYRSLARNREYSFINILGLAVGIASCLILFFVVRYELSFDMFHVNRNKIYRVVSEINHPGGLNYTPGVPAPLPEAMRVDFPQVKQVATILSVPDSQIDVLNEAQPGEGKKFMEEGGVFFVEPQFFEMFSFEWLQGSPDRSLQEPNTVVLDEETAEKYFGNWQSAIGKFIEFRNTNVLKVTGILKNIPANSDFPLKVIISFKTRGEEPAMWGIISSRRQCYLLLDESTSREKIENLIPAFEKKNRHQDDLSNQHYGLQPLQEIHFDARYSNFNGRTVDKTTLVSLGIIGLLLIMAASINFVNLGTAQVIKKSKEVAVRRVLGSNRWQLFVQFYGETLLLLLMASLLSLLITQLALPFLKPLLNLPTQFNPVKPLEVTIFLTSISVIVTLLSGFYPAQVMWTFEPAQALKSKINSQTVGGISLRKGLVIIQFFIAQILILVTFIVIQQLDFFRKAPLGFNKESVLLFSLPTDSLSQARLEPFRNTLLQQPEIKHVSFSFSAPISRNNIVTGFRLKDSNEDALFETNLKYADVNFFKTYDITLSAGRIYQPSDTIKEYVVNQTFLRKMGIENPEDGLGKLITFDDTDPALPTVPLPIVGVVNDFHQHSLKEEIDPLILMSNKKEYKNAGIKIELGDTRQVIQSIEKIYTSYFPEEMFKYRFLDENIARQYVEEERLASLTRIFSGLAVFISCLGLYGLISFMAMKRTKEVGIRKVLGASVPHILMLFFKEFILLLLIAFVASSLVAWYFMSDWLNGFVYRIHLNIWTFVGALGLSILISLVTITFRSVRAALANPVDSLRND